MDTLTGASEVVSEIAGKVIQALLNTGTWIEIGVHFIVEVIKLVMAFFGRTKEVFITTAAEISVFVDIIKKRMYSTGDK